MKLIEKFDFDLLFIYVSGWGRSMKLSLEQIERLGKDGYERRLNRFRRYARSQSRRQL